MGKVASNQRLEKVGRKQTLGMITQEQRIRNIALTLRLWKITRVQRLEKIAQTEENRDRNVARKRDSTRWQESRD